MHCVNFAGGPPSKQAIDSISRARSRQSPRPTRWAIPRGPPTFMGKRAPSAWDGDSENRAQACRATGPGRWGRSGGPEVDPAGGRCRRPPVALGSRRKAKPAQANWQRLSDSAAASLQGKRVIQRCTTYQTVGANSDYINPVRAVSGKMRAYDERNLRKLVPAEGAGRAGSRIGLAVGQVSLQVFLRDGAAWACPEEQPC
jgi:hypothetical protein